jgi:hypothetical protein
MRGSEPHPLKRLLQLPVALAGRVERTAAFEIPQDHLNGLLHVCRQQHDADSAITTTARTGTAQAIDFVEGGVCPVHVALAKVVVCHDAQRVVQALHRPAMNSAGSTTGAARTATSTGAGYDVFATVPIATATTDDVGGRATAACTRTVHCQAGHRRAAVGWVCVCVYVCVCTVVCAAVCRTDRAHGPVRVGANVAVVIGVFVTFVDSGQGLHVRGASALGLSLGPNNPGPASPLTERLRIS